MGGNFKFQAQDSFLECFQEIGRFEKRISLSEKKAPLVHHQRSMVLVKSQTFLLFPQIDKSVLKCWSLGGCQESRLLKVPETASQNFLLNIPTWSDFAIGLVLLLTSLVFLSGCLILIVAILKSTLQGICQVLFFSLDLLVTKNQIANTKSQ